MVRVLGFEPQCPRSVHILDPDAYPYLLLNDISKIFIGKGNCGARY
jgi:hypothetical protein